jgi:uncharacterized protein (DUF58 family)
MRRAQRIRLDAIVLFAIAAVALACGTLYVLITPLDAASSAIVPAAIAGLGSAILIGTALADIRYARQLERRSLERTPR